MLVDSHCHLNMLDLSLFQGDLKNAILAAKKQDVNTFLCVAVDLEHFPDVLKVAQTYPEVFASMGIHPNEKLHVEPSEDELVKRAKQKKVIAIGETGLDYYRSDGDLSWQQERFRKHIRVAKKLHKPLIIHSRQAREDTIRILQDEKADEVRGIMHCFTEDWDMAKKAMDLGFLISFSGIVTFKNAADLQDLVKKIPLECLLVETDAPYLAPIPFRGKPNEPAYVRYVAEKIAELKNVSYAEVAQKTTHNFLNLFQQQMT